MGALRHLGRLGVGGLASGGVLSFAAGVSGVFVVFGGFVASIFTRRKAVLEFESEVLEQYLKTRSELFKTQTDSGQTSAEPQ